MSESTDMSVGGMAGGGSHPPAPPAPAPKPKREEQDHKTPEGALGTKGKDGKVDGWGLSPAYEQVSRLGGNLFGAEEDDSVIPVAVAARTAAQEPAEPSAVSEAVADIKNATRTAAWKARETAIQKAAALKAYAESPEVQQRKAAAKQAAQQRWTTARTALQAVRWKAVLGTGVGVVAVMLAVQWGWQLATQPSPSAPEIPAVANEAQQVATDPVVVLPAPEVTREVQQVPAVANGAPQNPTKVQTTPVKPEPPRALPQTPAGKSETPSITVTPRRTPTVTTQPKPTPQVPAVKREAKPVAPTVVPEEETATTEAEIEAWFKQLEQQNATPPSPQKSKE